MPPMSVTNSDIAAWRTTIENNYNRYKREYTAAKAAGDKKKMQSVGRKMKATLRDGKTWTKLVAAEKALGRKNLPAECQRMCTEKEWLENFDPDR
ncbi:hypothetical protein DHEL01_v212922 [Diaporthe helianthi]|uniref:Uncharacterized protein n=1 Tax=Diaporthe helianthi TaxID=158607 RepID=A0A2P5HEK6_DIAHE|nr:hypothetical protein DHEL01_v212922 [Diaporthe helianthi]